jgi:hypothetical protein
MGPGAALPPGPRLVGGGADVGRDHRVDVSDEINAFGAMSDTPLDDLANVHRTKVFSPARLFAKPTRNLGERVRT